MRQPKTGYVYILEGSNDSGDSIAKFGCSSNSHINRRVSFANRAASERFGGLWVFTIKKLYLSCDIFLDESKIKWSLWNIHCIPTKEFFDSSMINYAISKIKLTEVSNVL